MLSHEDYERIDRGRAYFEDFGPFGDFDLFLALTNKTLKLFDIPIRYKERAYGDTDIQGWKHGIILTKMVLFWRAEAVESLEERLGMKMYLNTSKTRRRKKCWLIGLNTG